MLVKLTKTFILASALTFTIVVAACAEPDSTAIQDTQKELVKNSVSSIKKPSESTDFDNMTDAEVDAWLESEESDGKIALTINSTNIRVEYADTAEKRQLGLMFRREMCESCGMLFKFDSRRVGSIWMKNTFIPLDLAYIDENGKIIDIKPLEPHNLTSVRSSLLVLYALEMNAGWFAKQDIRVGDIVELLP